MALLQDLLNHRLANSTKDSLHLRRIDGAGKVVEHPVTGRGIQLEELCGHKLLRAVGIVSTLVVREARLKRHLPHLVVEEIDLYTH